MSDRANIIPPSVIKTAEFIKQCESDPNCQGYYIMRKRNTGLRFAQELAKAEDTNFEILERSKTLKKFPRKIKNKAWHCIKSKY